MNIGQVVYLKSGSAAMVITNPDNNHGQVDCAWMNDNKQINMCEFPGEVLTAEKPASDQKSSG